MRNDIVYVKGRIIYRFTDLPRTVYETENTFKFLMKTVCLKFNLSSAKTNILLDGAIITTVLLNIMACKEIPGYLLSTTKYL